MLDTEGNDLVCFCKEQWLSHENMLMRSHKLQDEVKQVMEMGDLAFVVDITNYLSELGINSSFSNRFSLPYKYEIIRSQFKTVESATWKE